MSTPQTFSDLLARRARTDGPTPLVTYYDLGSGERTELSVTTYANWVAKTASLLVEELDAERGDDLVVDLPPHWLSPVFWGAAWAVGLRVLTDPAAGEPVVRVCGPETLTAAVQAAADATDSADTAVLATALHPLGLRFADPLPAGVRDYGVEVWSQPDAFVAYDPPTGADPALDALDQSALCGTAREPASGTGAGLAPGERLLTDRLDPALFLAALDHGSLVLVRAGSGTNPGSPADAERIAAQEKADRVQLAAL